jgi:hypothetical protein
MNSFISNGLVCIFQKKLSSKKCHRCCFRYRFKKTWAWKWREDKPFDFGCQIDTNQYFVYWTINGNNFCNNKNLWLFLHSEYCWIEMNWNLQSCIQYHSSGCFHYHTVLLPLPLFKSLCAANRERMWISLHLVIEDMSVLKCDHHSNFKYCEEIWLLRIVFVKSKMPYR